MLGRTDSRGRLLLLLFVFAFGIPMPGSPWFGSF